MNNPWIKAAKAAWSELSSEDAVDFFKSTAMEHSLMTMFYFLEAVHWTVEAGRMTRRFVDSFSTPESEAPTTPVVIAGLLPPAKDEPPLTTQAVITNQQKMEQHLAHKIKEIYENVQLSEEGGEVGDRQSSEPPVEPVQVGVLHPTDNDSPPAESPVPTRKRKPRGSASGGNGGQGSNKSHPKSRVSGTGSRVQGKRHAQNADV